MASSPDGRTLFLPDSGRPTAGGRTGDTGLDTDLISQSASRLRTLAYLYAFVFFMADFFPALSFAEQRAELFSEVSQWLPGTLSIAMALLVAAFSCSRYVTPHTAMKIGLTFEVLGSYGIASAEFPDALALSAGLPWWGVSWVALWTLMFTMLVPTHPRSVLVAAVLSVSAVPVVLILLAPERLEPGQFFFVFILPYLLVVLMAYVGSRVVYGLGREVTRARELGSYELVERLGEGGMGEVWRAKHRLLARPAAIKLIRPSLAGDTRQAVSDEARRRFELEAQTISRLRSPHTVSLYDFGIAKDGSFYFVMELLDGLDADTLVRRSGPLQPERAIAILRQVCHSLSEAEANGLVHRDIKPANIFLCRYGEEFDFVKVLDFGIVKPAQQSAETSLTLATSENAVRGTPAFIAPEQALGMPVDNRADIYSIGCVGYWLLSGQLVFTAETQMGLLIHHAHTPAPLLSARTDRPIPRALEDLIMSCLSKDPAERPQSARELSARLAAIDVGQEWTPQRAQEWWDVSGPVRVT